MTDQELAARQAAWADYWSGGSLHSCPGSYSGNYGGAIGAFWQRRLPGLQAGARVLDIATGNGALPLRIWQSHGDSITVEAIDYAAVQPAWHQPGTHPRLRFHGGVDMAALPFEAANFDVVCSQFGIEYGARPHAMNEALRVVRGSGRLWCVLHHAGSELVAVAGDEADAYAGLLREDGLLAVASRLAHWLARARTGETLPPAANATREDYNRLLREWGNRYGEGRARGLAADVVQAIHSALGLAAQGRAAEAGDALVRYRGEIERAALRGRELVAHALGEEDMRDWCARILDAWPEARIGCEVLRQQQGIVAWGLDVELQPAA